MALGGRPKEEGGHKPLKISVDKEIHEALEKIAKAGGNKSQAIEKAFRPIAKKYDPGILSIHIWRWEVYYSREIIKAAEEGKPDDVQALAATANALKDFRSMADIPPLDAKLLSTETSPSWKKQAFEDLIKMRNAVVNEDPDDLVRVPRATLLCIETYPKLTEKMSSEKTELENQMKWAYDFPGYILRDPYLGIVKPRQRLKIIANVTVPKILKKAFAILQEN